MTYSVKEIFKTLQGEGAQSGRAAVFCRFSGCNLWTGRESDRLSAVCQFCDTDFVGTDGVEGGKFDSASALATKLAATWGHGVSRRYVVFTGGEPLLQLDAGLIDAVHQQGFEIALETNGTLPVPHGVDWICVSPKASAPWVQRAGHELKLVYPQSGLLPDQIDTDGFEHYFLQPMDGPHRHHNTERAVAYIQNHPRWRLSLQTHKVIGIA